MEIKKKKKEGDDFTSLTYLVPQLFLFIFFPKLYAQEMGLHCELTQI